MSKTISGVPEFFTREQYASLFHAVGIDPMNTLSLRFLTSGVEAVVFERDEQGNKFPAGDPDDEHSGWAKSVIHIPIR